MLPQKLSKISFKLSDLQEFEDMKRKKAVDTMVKATPGDDKAATILTVRKSRKTLTFGPKTSQTPIRSSTPDTE